MPAYEAIDREPIWVALLARLRASLGTSVVSSGRQLTQPPALSAEMQPACFLVDVNESRKPRPSGSPGAVTLNGFIVLYFQAPAVMLEPVGEETILGDTLLNSLLLAIDTALLPDDIVSGRQTLGGLVQHCWIEGEVSKDTGMYSQQGAAIIPIKILVP